MQGELKGVFFKGVVNSMLSGSVDVLFPDIRDRVAQMDDDSWYPWDEFREMVGRIGAKLNSTTITTIAKRLILASEEIFRTQGFDTLDKLLQSYPDMFNTNIRGVPDTEQVKLKEFEPGRALYHYPGGQPAAMIEGYFRGFFAIYEVDLGEFSITPQPDGNYEVSLHW